MLAGEWNACKVGLTLIESVIPQVCPCQGLVVLFITIKQSMFVECYSECVRVCVGAGLPIVTFDGVDVLEYA